MCVDVDLNVEIPNLSGNPNTKMVITTTRIRRYVQRELLLFHKIRLRVWGFSNSNFCRLSLSHKITFFEFWPFDEIWFRCTYLAHIIENPELVLIKTAEHRRHDNITTGKNWFSSPLLYRSACQLFNSIC